MKALLPILLFATGLHAAALPGFRTERLGATAGFVSSIAVDSRGIIYYTSTAGTLFRFDGATSTAIATVETDGVGNSGLLGMALENDRSAIVHYTTPNQTHDVISRISLETGEETVIHKFACDVEVPERGSSSEHHGGNPHVAEDGTIWVGIGDYGSSKLAALKQWNGGKIFRISRDGRLTQFAIGLRNPFDLFWDKRNQRLVVADNGPIAGDEIHVVDTAGANLGWPVTWGAASQTNETSAPDYVWTTTIAPTGMTPLSDAHPTLKGGFLVGSFVTRAIYWFRNVDELPLAEPLVLIQRETAAVIDIAQARNGDIFFATGNAIYRLIPPARGDCNGDGVLTGEDMAALTRAIRGELKDSLGCDCNADGVVTEADRAELVRILTWRRRSVR